MMGGSFPQHIFGELMGQILSKAEMQIYAQQMSEQHARHANAVARQAAIEAIPAAYKPMVSTGPGLLPKDLIPDLETAADIPARIARMVETLIESRKAKSALPQWGPGSTMNSWATASAQQNQFFIRGF